MRNYALEEERRYVVYLHVVPKEISGYPHDKYYVGITCQNVNERFKNGLGYDGCTLFYKAILKYGWENITHLILLDNLSKHDACIMEQMLIKHFNSKDPIYGYNLNDGGEIGNMGYRHTEETRKLIGEKGKGRTPPNKGIPTTEEKKAKLREAWVRRKARGGELGTKKPVIVYPINKRYDSMIDACRDLNLNYSSARSVVEGRRNSIFGYTFAYVGGYINQIKEG